MSKAEENAIVTLRLGYSEEGLEQDVLIERQAYIAQVEVIQAEVRKYLNRSYADGLPAVVQARIWDKVWVRRLESGHPQFEEWFMDYSNLVRSVLEEIELSKA